MLGILLLIAFELCGLAIARSIAALHYGDIFLESNEASGTAFIVTLPEDAK